MKYLITYFDCGKYYEVKGKNKGEFGIHKFLDIVQKVIPLFQKYPIEGVKGEDFADFCRVAELMKSEKQKTKEGFEEIKRLKDGMNRGRSFTNLDSLEGGKLLGRKLKVGVRVLDEKGELAYSFNTLKECAEFFAVHSRTINRRIVKGSIIEFNGKNLVFKREVELP